MEQQIHFCTTHDGARIAYATVGQGPPLVKAANWLNHLEFDWQSPIWRHLLREFARDHTFIRYDERGNGLSDWNVADLSFNAWVDDLESVVAAAKVDRFPLLGISQGGAVAIAYAVRHPERVSHLILYGAYARGWAKRDSAEEIEQRQAQLTLVRLGWGKDNPAFRQLWTSLYAPDATPEQAQSFNDLQRMSTSPENAVKLLNEMGNIDVVDLLSQVKVPTLVLHCRDEAGVPFEEGRKIAGSIPGARFVPLAGRNHLLLEGAPSWGMFVKEIRRFLGTEVTSAMTQTSGSSSRAKPDLHRTDLPERYSIISFLGVGGMGEVYLAEDTRLGRKVAIKTLPAEFTNDKERLRRFHHEARAASALNHPNLLTIHEIGSEAGAHFIAAEYIDGETLRIILKRGRMKIDDALDVAQQAAFALTAAHGAGIVHRDIKPENIMIRKDGIVKVLDFGLAKLLEDHARDMVDHEADTRALVLTDPGRVLGTPQYMSPEQARGMDLDARTDIWSLGVVLYEMIAGRPPFRGETKSHTVVSILETEPAPLTTFARDLPAELQRIVRKALTKDRDSRYQTARDLMIDLKTLRRDLDIQSEMRRSISTENGSKSDVANQESAGFAGSPAVTGMADKRSTVDGADVRDGSIRYRLGALVLMVIVAVGALVVWYYLRNNSAPSAISSIAVLPFVNASGNSDTEYLSDGMTESLITSLSQLRNVSVKARSSVFRYKGKDVSPQEIGRDLNVQAVVNGRIVQRGNDLTLHIELVDVKSETALWSGDYTRSMTNLVSLQNEIAGDVSQKLEARLSSTDKQRVTKAYTANAEAYQLYLKGRYYWNKRDAEDLKQAIDEFKAATDKDPNYALAYVGLADSYALMEFYAGTRAAESLPLARAAAEHALQIDDSLAEAHASLGLINQYSWRWDESEKEFQRALNLNPNYATARQWYGSYLKKVHRFDDALQEIKKAQELDPFSPIISDNLCESYCLKNDFESAIKECKKAIDLDPAGQVAYGDLGTAYLKSGRQVDAIAAFEKAAEISNRSSVSLSRLGFAYALTGRQKEARAVLRELIDRYATQKSPGFYVAVVCVGLGDNDQAFEWLEKDFQSRSAVLPFLAHWPLFESLRSDSRYAALLARMGLRA
jgi:serine/threonine protein kinase/pimeloyl-ACP methyl ester carboxylesterase/Flp pilus assembly protein TadD